MNNEEKKIDYLFVWKNDGWWLKITTPAQLFDYWDKTDGKWSEVLSNLIRSKEFGWGMEHATALSFVTGMYANKVDKPLLNAVADFAGEIKGQQLKFLMQYGTLYFNQKGGYHFRYNDDTETQFCRRKDLVWPGFKEKDIRIKSFPGGTHFYAYIGDVQVRAENGLDLKWDTYEEAMQEALALVTVTERDEEREER